MGSHFVAFRRKLWITFGLHGDAWPGGVVGWKLRYFLELNLISGVDLILSSRSNVLGASSAPCD